MDIFVELSFILIITVIVSAIMKILKQPLIIGYIISGIIASPYFLDLINSEETIKVFSQIGIALLLFIVGLSLSPKIIKEVGKVSLITGIGQILFTSIIGFFISKLLGFSTISSLYISLALTFSSTIIIMKLLSDKKDLEKLYGKISVGFLLVQDIFVIILLMIISSSKVFSFENTFILTILILSLFLTLKYISKITSFFAKSQELLFLFSISWGLGIASLFHYAGVSMEVGALIAGILLSTTPYAYEISSKMRPLRDFFIILFFILLGSQMVFEKIYSLLFPAIIFSLFILIGNPAIVIFLMKKLGYKNKISFQAGLTVAQISEFSLILITLGVNKGYLREDVLSLITIVGLITISASTYMILYSDKLYYFLSKKLKILKNDSEKDKKILDEYDVILLGYDKIGHNVISEFKKMKKKFLVVDYNPEIISKLISENINSIYGDIEDLEFIESLNLTKAKMVLSTIAKIESNILIVEKIREKNKKSIIIVLAHDEEEAELLYKKGATYVLLPHVLGGLHISELIKKHGLENKNFLKEKNKHLKFLRKRKKNKK